MMAYLQHLLNMLLTKKYLRKPIILFLATFFAVLFSEILVYIQVELFWPEEYHVPGYWIGFWTPLIDGFVIGLLAIFLLGQYEKKLIAEKAQLDQSIEYASLIQKAMFSDKEVKHYFQDHFTYIKQRDTVGGDFYSIIPLNEDELLILVIDGVGHGVSGAFITMLAKATEHQVVNELQLQKDEIHTSQILQRFNVLFKEMCNKDASIKASIGFDCGVVYFNRKSKLLRFSGARIPLFCVENNIAQVYRANRKGVGFMRIPLDYSYKEYEIEVNTRIKFYLATDGIFDQEGVDGKPFGKSRFKEIITKEYYESFNEQKNQVINSLKRFQGDQKQLDDMTLVGFSFDV